MRSLNDVALAYAGLDTRGRDVVIPLRMLAEFWVGYYWPFMDEHKPIFQGPRAKRGGKIWNDFAFREDLTRLKKLWMDTPFGSQRPSDGFVVMAEMKAARAADIYLQDFIDQYERVIKRIVGVIRYPIQYAGPGSQQYSVFSRPGPAGQWENSVWLPTTQAKESSLLFPAALWEGFKELSLWIEALCIHEWSLFSEKIQATKGANIDRGEAYTLLTERPDNRRPLTWERNQIDLLFMEGCRLTCPWTGKILTANRYDLDHIIPVSVYPINELWNLVPADRFFNTHRKRARLPQVETLQRAESAFLLTYQNYRKSRLLAPVLTRDTVRRFDLDEHASGADLVAAMTSMVLAVADARNVARF